MGTKHEPWETAVAQLRLNSYERHIFLCAAPSEPKCCDRGTGNESWEYLKRRLKVENLKDPQRLVQRTKANCLRVCMGGPIAVIYPDGVWYHSCTPEVLDLIVTEHLLGGRVVEQYVLARNRHPLF